MTFLVIDNGIMICPRSRGLVVRAVACEAGGPGFDSSSAQMFFLLLGYTEVGIDPDMPTSSELV